MKCLFTICGRAGSKGIKNKNIRDFLEFPLPLYTLAVIELLLQENRFLEGDIALNTDSPELVAILQGQNKELIVVERKEHLAGDKAAKRDVIIDTLTEAEQVTKSRYEVVVDLDITSPLRTVEDTARLLQVWKETGCDVAFSAVPSRRNPYFNMVKKADKGYVRAQESSFTTRQQAPELFDMNASLYAYSPSHLKEGKGVLEGYNEMIEMYDTGILDLDHENDFELMQVIAGYLFSYNEKFSPVYEYMKQHYQK